MLWAEGLTILAISTLFPAVFAPFVFVAAFMAFDAVGQVGDAFLAVFLKDVAHGMFMAAVTGIGGVIVVQMAGSTLGIVVAVQHKIGVVLKRGRHPLGGAVALGAIVFQRTVKCIGGIFMAACTIVPCRKLHHVVVESSFHFPSRGAVAFCAGIRQLPVQFVLRFLVTAHTFIRHLLGKHGMIKTFRSFFGDQAGMVRMAGGTIQFVEFFVKQHLFIRSNDLLGIPANCRQFMASNTPVVFNPPEWLVASETLLANLLVSLHQFTRTEHDVRIQHKQYHENDCSKDCG